MFRTGDAFDSYFKGDEEGATSSRTSRPRAKLRESDVRREVRVLRKTATILIEELT